MISWQRQMEYDPLGDCSRNNRNREHWDGQMRRVAGCNQRPMRNKTNVTTISEKTEVVKRKTTKSIVSIYYDLVQFAPQKAERFIELDDMFMGGAIMTPDEIKEYEYYRGM